MGLRRSADCNEQCNVCKLCSFYSADVSESFNGATTIPHRDFTKGIQVFAATWPLLAAGDNPQLRSQIITLPKTLSSHLIVPVGKSCDICMYVPRYIHWLYISFHAVHHVIRQHLPVCLYGRVGLLLSL